MNIRVRAMEKRIPKRALWPKIKENRSQPTIISFI